MGNWCIGISKHETKRKNTERRNTRQGEIMGTCIVCGESVEKGSGMHYNNVLIHKTCKYKIKTYPWRYRR